MPVDMSKYLVEPELSPFIMEGVEVALFRRQDGDEPVSEMEYKRVKVDQTKWQQSETTRPSFSGGFSTMVYNDVKFPTARSSWGMIQYFAVMDGNKILYQEEVSPPRRITNGDTVNVRLSIWVD